jgi:altronate hydrolase
MINDDGLPDEGPERLVDDGPLNPPPVAGREVANIVVLADKDNVGIAVRDIAAGELARASEGRSVRTSQAIPLGHKVALKPIGRGGLIVRFGVPVGVATADIPTGSLVHVHNVKSQYLDNVEDHYE